jgi:ABC-type amino acid transport substrate-binding protein/transcriptional regulator with XRE-family HTH domain
MNESTRKRLEAAGARVTTVKEFLDLSDADMAFIEMKIALAKKLREYRQAAELTQEQVAKRVGSSQSRVAKMEAGDPAVTMDLLVGSLLRLGARPQVVAETIETAIDAASSAAKAAKPRRKRRMRRNENEEHPGRTIRRRGDLPMVAFAAGLAFLLGAGLVLQPAAFADRAAAESGGVPFLRVCLYPGFKPFAWKDGDAWKGWDVDYLKGFAKANHLTFKAVEEEAFEDIWLRPGRNECDIAATGISDTADRRKATGDDGAWSATYYTVVRAYLVRTADKEKLKDVSDLSGKTVIVTGGSTADHDLRNRLQQHQIKNVTILNTNNEEAAADEVLKGSAFAYGGGYGSVVDLAKRGGRAAVWPHCNMVSVGKGEFKPYAEPEDQRLPRTPHGTHLSERPTAPRPWPVASETPWPAAGPSLGAERLFGVELDR